MRRVVAFLGVWMCLSLAVGDGPETVMVVLRPSAAYAFNGAERVPAGLTGAEEALNPPGKAEGGWFSRIGAWLGMGRTELDASSPRHAVAQLERFRAAVGAGTGSSTPSVRLGSEGEGMERARRVLLKNLLLLRLQPDLIGEYTPGDFWGDLPRGDAGKHAWALIEPLRGPFLDMSVDRERVVAAASHPEEGRVVVVGVDGGTGPVRMRMPMSRGFRVVGLTVWMGDFSERGKALLDVRGEPVPRNVPKGESRLVGVLPRLSRGFIEFDLPEGAGFRLELQSEGYAPYRTRRQSFRLIPVLGRDLTEGEELKVGVEEPPDPERLFVRAVYRGAPVLAFEDGEVKLPESDGRSLETVEVPPGAVFSSPVLRSGAGGVRVEGFGWVWED